MIYTTINITSASCGPVSYFGIPFPKTLSSELRAVFIFRIAVNAVSCPFVILLNILVMVAVKTKRQLRTKSNVSLACLATTDLIVGVVVQPLQIVRHSFMLKGETGMCGGRHKITVAINTKCIIASLNHFVVLSAEHYLAIKHPFAYENLVTEVRIIVSSALAWAVAIIPPMEDFWPANIQYVAKVAVLFMQFIFLALVFYFNVSVYREVRCNEKQIIAKQVSVEVKEKLLKNKKAFCCTIIVMLTIFLCYFSVIISAVIIISVLEDSIPINVKHIIFNLLSLLPVLNSLFNPLIYAVRIRYFRVAFIQLLSRKTIGQAEKLERNIFGPKNAGDVVEHGESRFSRGELRQLGK